MSGSKKYISACSLLAPPAANSKLFYVMNCSVHYCHKISAQDGYDGGEEEVDLYLHEMNTEI
jgi:hypothetical protein